MHVRVDDDLDPEPSDWWAAERLLKDHPTRWGSLSWISARSLIDSVNDALGRASDGLVDQLRQAWVEQIRSDPKRPSRPDPEWPQPAGRAYSDLPVDELADWLIIDRKGAERFLVVGDTGEQDPSQYVVSPAIAAAANAGCDFVVIMSDVIYPAGDVDDYVDGLYRPYRTPESDDNSKVKFLVKPPIIALPGNHDWYDGLAGFMYHFVDQQPLPSAAYAPTRETWIWSRLIRVLWRRPRPARAEARHRHESHPITQSFDKTYAINQPGPYFAIRMPHLLLVCIDTGIGGNIDEQQWDWLERISRLTGPKVLLTGKPLVVNGKIVPCYIGHRRSARKADSVWNLVIDKDYEYIATLGGDTHNYQKYERKQTQGFPQYHLVSGGGGAFTHATHPNVSLDRDARFQDDLQPDPAKPRSVFPSYETSLRFFADLLVPSVVRTLLFLLLIVLGGLVVLGLQLTGLADAIPTVTTGAVLCLLAIGAIRLLLTKRITRETTVARVLAPVGGFLLGIVTAGVAQALDPEHFSLYFTWWAVLTGYNCVVSAALRRSGWWLPKADFRRTLPTWVFAVGLVLLSLVSAGLAYAASVEPSWGAIAAAGLIPLVVGAIGYVIRAKHQVAVTEDQQTWRIKVRNWLVKNWNRLGMVLAPAVPLSVAIIVLCQLTQAVGRSWLVTGAVAGVGLTLGLVAAAGVVVLAATEALAVVAASVPRPRGLTKLERKRWSWGRVSAVTHHLPSPVLLAGTVAWIVYCAGDSPVNRAASGLPLVIFTTVGLLLFVGWLRRRFHRRYLLAIVIAFVGIVALVLSQAFVVGQPVMDPLLRDWPSQVVLGTLVVLVALLTSVTLGHMSFLNAQLLLRPSYWKGPYFETDEQAARFIEVRLGIPPGTLHADPPATPTDEPAVRPADIPLKAWTAGRITWPGLGEPGGPLQSKVSEVFSSDTPPFHKNFLTLESTAEELVITVHRVAVPDPGRAASSAS